MASGILGGGALQMDVRTHGYTTPSGKTTTTSLLLYCGPMATSVSLSLGGVVALPITVPANGLVTLTGLVLAAGQGVYLTSYGHYVSYLLTGWESQV